MGGHLYVCGRSEVSCCGSLAANFFPAKSAKGN